MDEETQDYIEEREIKGVLLIKRPAFPDDRGFFRETFRKKDLDNKLGFEFNPVQANHSRSQKNSLRGIHIAPWNKLVTVLRGQVQQVVVDLRKDSETFGKHISIILGEDNWYSLFIPKGVGNAFLVLSEEADYHYLTTDYWEVGREKNVAFDDPDLNISWQTKDPILSEKDLHNPSVKEVFPR